MPSPDTSAFEAALAVGAAHLKARAWSRAAAAFAKATRRRPDAAAAWRGLGDARHGAGDAAGGGDAHLRALAASATEPLLTAAAAALTRGDIAAAGPLLMQQLRRAPTDVAALRMLGETASAAGRDVEAARAFALALDLAPGFVAARARLSEALTRASPPAALAEIDRWLARQPRHHEWRRLRIATLERGGDYEGALAAARLLTAEAPGHPGVALMPGYLHKTLGDPDAAVAAWRRALALRPALGEAWWALANLKTQVFDEVDRAAMTALLADPALAIDNRIPVEFALAKALDDAGDHAAAFRHYAAGNAAHRAGLNHDRAALPAYVDRVERVFLPAFFAARAGSGVADADPIFIVGLPRAGSTLVEQILGSHPEVEATMELEVLPQLAHRLGNDPGTIAALTPEQLRRLGQAYLDAVRPFRRSGRPRFVDKQPGNFLHIGLIRLILPNATIIDMRRGRMASGFSIFRQLFAGGHDYGYDLGDIAAYRAGYERLMAHWQTVLPGAVHAMTHEALVAAPEAEIRRLLAHCGLAFDPACLASHESRRPVRTPSAEQVRRPINADGIDSWRPYAEWLGALA